MSLDRRQYLKIMGTSVAGFYVLGFLGGCEAIKKKIQNRPVRRSITSLANNDPIVQAYRDGVAQMKALPASDPRNWERQAQIHNNFCPHGNWYFLPWHRAYLFYFESIVRELSGFAEFALPYWNWTCSPRIPAHFFGAGNPLLDTTRTKTASDVIPTGFTGETLLADILAIPDFDTFGSFPSTALRGGSGGGYGELEGTPHNLVHGWIGGNMGGFMSPRDPVFWCHHNMIERCWWDWNITQGKSNPSAPAWADMTMNNMFCDKDGNPVTNLTVGITALMPVLGYQFDDQLLPCARRLRGFKADVRSTAELREFLQRGGPHKLRVQEQVRVDAPNAILVQGRSLNRIALPRATTPMLLRKTRAEQRLVLKINQAKLVHSADVFVRVYINPPADVQSLNTDSPHYAGSFAFFGDGSHGHHHGHHTGNTYHIDVTNTLETLLQRGLINDRSDVNLVLQAVSITDGQSVPRGTIELRDIDILMSEGFE